MDGIVIVDPPQSGFLNMAMDRALADYVRKEPICVLRFYQWEEPTLSLGYFQSFAEAAAHPVLGGLSTVRRETGGGAIVHHHELTYSVTIPETTGKGHHETLYQVIHEAALKVIREYLPEANFQANEGGFECRSECGKDRFLCFERRSSQDIVAKGFKIVGSAQKRRSSALSQHGSILLRSSPLTPHLPGVLDLAESHGNPDWDEKEVLAKEQADESERTLLFLNSLQESLKTGLASQFEVAWRPDHAKFRLRSSVLSQFEEQFQSLDWTRRH